jgi:hypothetical protein
VSFLHQIRVGFFGTRLENRSARDLSAEECLEWLKRYNECAPEALRVSVEPDPAGTPNRGMVLGSAEGYPITLKAGVLSCPYLATKYVTSSIGFVAFLHKTIGCSIYSDDDSKFLTLEEFIPREAFATIMQAVTPPMPHRTAEPLGASSV